MVKTAFLIHGSNRGMWLWKYYYYWFKKYWIDTVNLEPIILYETLKPDIPDIRMMETGRVPWGEGLINCLDKLDHKYIIYVHEDYFLTATPNYTLVNQLINLMDEKNLVLMKMCGWWAGWDDPKHIPTETDMHVNDQIIYLYNNDSQYLTSQQPSIWNKDFLKSTIQPHWSPWDHELKGSTKLKERHIPLHAYRGEWPIPIAECASRDTPRPNTEKYFNISI